MVVLLVGMALASRPLDEQLPWVPLSQSMVLSAVSAFTAVLMYAQVKGSGRSGYRWIGGSFLYAGIVAASIPFFTPGAFGGDEPVVGEAGILPWLHWAWHGLLAIGLGVAMIEFAFERPRRRHRPGDLSIWPSIAAATAAAVAVIGGSVILAGRLPSLPAEQTLVTTPVSRAVAVGLVLCLVAVVAAAWTRRGSFILRYLGATIVAVVAELVALSASEPWSLGWYVIWGVDVFVMSVLFMVLAWQFARFGISRVDRARRDSLTGVESRAFFSAGVDNEISRARQFGEGLSLLWVDLDGFKSVNDTLGHPIGDEILREAALRLRGGLPEGGRLGRMGGDEFAILLSESSDVTALSDELIERMKEPFGVSEGQVTIAASIGLARFPHDAATADELMNRADLAMYQAKREGGARLVRYSTEIGAAALTRSRLRHEIAEALRAHGFTLEYQPIVEPTTGVPRGAEALTRWENRGQPIPPSTFISAAEDTGLITGIGRFVVSQLEQDAPVLLHALGDEGFMTFNLSITEINDDEILDQLCNGPLNRIARRITVEVTESNNTEAGPVVQARIQRLREVGYRLAVDDYGAGYSNVHRLQQLRPDLLKIDRSIVVNAGRDRQRGGSFMTAAVSVGRSLGARVLAEGVQTDREHALVCFLGVDLAQGFRYGRSMGAQAFLAWVAERAERNQAFASIALTRRGAAH